jgi:hypothetical protein
MPREFSTSERIEKEAIFIGKHIKNSIDSLILPLSPSHVFSPPFAPPYREAEN